MASVQMRVSLQRRNIGGGNMNLFCLMWPRGKKITTKHLLLHCDILLKGYVKPIIISVSSFSKCCSKYWVT